MRKIVIFTMILTLIFGTVGCTAHSKPDKKAIENSSTNAIVDITQAEDLFEKTEDETVEKSTLADIGLSQHSVAVSSRVKLIL